jgi:hypothetical protein
VSVPSSTSMPPPKTLAELAITRELTRRAPAVSPVMAMPPPTQHPFPSTDATLAMPFVIFSPSTVVVPSVMWSTVPAPPPFRVAFLPCPFSVRFLLTSKLPTQLPQC